MPGTITPSTARDTSINRVATLIEQDIRSRGLRPGDRYLTAKEAGRLLGFSPATCHRAMKLLAERDVLSRRQNSGTFINQTFEAQQPSLSIRTIYVALSVDRELGVLSRDQLMNGLWRELPGVGLHFVILPKGNEVSYLQGLLASSAAAGQLMGVVAVCCPRDVYEYLTCQSVPVVVIGSIDPSCEKLASVDGDERQAGRLLASHMVQQGHREFAVLLGEVWRPGDNCFLEGVQEALHEAGLGIGAFRVRGLPHDVQVFRQQVCPLVASAKGPLAIICQDASFVPWLDDLQSAERQQWADVRIAYNADMELPKEIPLRHPCTYQTVSTFEMSAVVGKMIAQLGAGRELSERHVLLPMALYDPGTRGACGIVSD